VRQNARRSTWMRYAMIAIPFAAIAGAVAFYLSKPTRGMVVEANSSNTDSGTARRVVPESTVPSMPSPQANALPSLRTPSKASSPLGNARETAYDALIAQARSGDATASERLYDDTRLCRRAAQSENQANAELNAPTEGLSAEQAEQRAEMLTRIQRDLDQSHDVCAGAYGDAVKRNAEEIALLAARAGNQAASACYVRGDFRDEQLSSEDALSQFKANSAALIDAALRNGSWQMISTLAIAAYGNSRHHGPQPPIAMRDMAKGYAYIKLQQLAATGDLAIEKGRQLQNIIDSAEVPPEAISEGDRWARDMQARFFHTPFESEMIVDCYGAPP